MIQKITTDEDILSKPCAEITNFKDPAFLSELQDLLDTATFHSKGCASLAFNQISVLKRGFVIKTTGGFRPVINPEYVMKSTSKKSRYETCLSRPGEKAVKKRRSTKVKLKFWDVVDDKGVMIAFHGFAARVVQHEMDHLKGELI